MGRGRGGGERGEGRRGRLGDWAIGKLGHWEREREREGEREGEGETHAAHTTLERMADPPRPRRALASSPRSRALSPLARTLAGGPRTRHL